MNLELYGTRLYVNYTHLEKNIQYVKKQFPQQGIIAILKANAYGHGDVDMAQKMEELNINYFGVADFEEGLRLRRFGIKGHIMVMNPGLNNLSTIIENHLEPVIYNHEMLHELGVLAQNNIIRTPSNIRIHIKINSGMNRWGFNLLELSGVIKALKQFSNITIVSIYSHFSSAETIEQDVFTKCQTEVLMKAYNLFQSQFDYTINLHLFNSAALLRNFLTTDSTLLRVGILLYGGLPHNDLNPVSELRCAISQIREINSGDSVGYERKFIASGRKKIAIIPFGYADGLQRHWGNGTLKFFHKKQLLPTIGNISMDSCVLDISGIDISVGDDVLYFGKERPIWELANELNTIPYEIMATLSRRIKRVYHY